MVEGRFEIDGLNCQDAHVRELRSGRPGTLRYGWAVAPDGRRYQHCWIQTPEGQVDDLFGWTEHEDLGERYWK
jgi:hypothetical protein